ncbi:MAG: hypothetical protein V3R98_02680 [Alphaproteobacteria bacterium]
MKRTAGLGRLVPVACCVLAICGGQAVAQRFDRTDPIAVATASLEAYQARDLDALMPLVSSFNRSLIQELAVKGESHPRYGSLFSGWRWRAVEAWSGFIGEVRYRRRSAMVEFGTVGDAEVAVVALEWEDGGWSFEDVNSPSTADFRAMPTTRP